MLISWIHQKYLKHKLDFLKRQVSTPSGGNLLNEIIDLIFRYNGFRTVKTTRRTRYGDQIDVHVLWDRPILVECKYHKKRASKADIEQFKTRVGKRPPLTIGMFVSWNGFTKGAIDEIVQHQERAIMAFTGEEIEAIIDNKIDLEYLIELKLYYLQRGEVYIRPEINKFLDLENFFNSELFDVENLSVRYPSDLSFCDYQQNSNFHVATPILFAIDKLFLDGKWYFIEFYPRGKSDNVYFNTRGFLELIEAYNRMFGFSENFSFGITQNTVLWYGFGITNFLEAVLFQNLRYNQLPELTRPPLHDSESVVALDYWSDNFILLLNLYPYVLPLFKKMKYLTGAIVGRYLDFKLGFKEFPYNQKRIDKFAYLANLDYSLTVNEVKKVHVPITNQIEVEPLEYITYHSEFFQSKDEKWVRGVIMKNPFKKNISKKSQNEIQKFLSQFERVVAYCRDHFTTEDSKKLYLKEAILYILPESFGASPLVIELCVNW